MTQMADRGADVGAQGMMERGSGIVFQIGGEQFFYRRTQAFDDGRLIARMIAAGFCRNSGVASIASQCVRPRTTTNLVSKRSAANSTLPTKDGAMMLPATRITNKSPRLDRT